MKLRKQRGETISNAQFGFLLALPALLIFSFIVLYPFVNSLFMSLFDRSLIYPTQEFVGFDNFRRVISDPNFTGVIRNTVIFVFGTTAVSFILGFIWALILNQGYRGSEFFRGVTLCAWIIPGAAIAFLWMWIFHGQYGVLNYVLRSIGVLERNYTWLGSRQFAMLAVILARGWQAMPWFMLLLLGGLKGISFDQVEAARIDGAGNIRVLWNVVLPGMRQIISVTLLIGIIMSLQHFDIIWVMTQGGPARGTTTFSIEVYRNAFQNYHLGRAAAVGAIWSAILSVFVVMNLRARAQEE